jgi:CO dehydrogenase/acetyl-CoA synthase epsilon subunit
VKTLLEAKGYKGITTGNADKYDYVQSEMQIKKGMEYLKDTLLADVKGSLADPKVTELAGTSSVDVVIIIGKDVK